MNAQQREGIALLGTLTSGFYDAYRVAGGHNGANRARILGLIKGQKMPIAKSGVNALREALFEVVKPEGDCLASRENDVCAKLHAQGFAVHPNAL